MKYISTIADREFAIEIIDDSQILVDGVAYDVDFESISGQLVFSMQNELKSPRDGIVSRVRVKEGDNVERKQTLLSVI
jgi:multidrug efflux pump subunit AcrA (membrane-fusion protein)